MIIFNIYTSYRIDAQTYLDSSCTILWLIRFYPLYIQTNPKNNSMLNTQLTEIWINLASISNLASTNKCNFNARLSNCNRTRRLLLFTDQNSSTMDFMIIAEFLLIVIFSPLASLIGIISNLLVIIVVYHKSNRKELKEKHYNYMAITSMSNILIFLIQLLKLMNECHEPFGIYCSRVHKFLFFQYFDIAIDEFFLSYARLLTNFTYMAFSLNRLSLIGNKHSCLTQRVANAHIRNYLALASLVSVLVSIVKIFHKQINVGFSDESYPIEFDRNMFRMQMETENRLIFIFNAIYDLINYVAFVLVNLIVEIALVVRLKQTLAEKEAKLASSLSEKAMEKKIEEDAGKIRRVVKMVVLNLLVNFLFKVPAAITSLNDLRIVTSSDILKTNMLTPNVRTFFTFDYSMRYVCSLDNICKLFQNFVNFLFLISLSLNILFFYYFDSKFNEAFSLVFPKRKN